MVPVRWCLAVVVSIVTSAAASSAHATFHFIQLEQVIGGVYGDITAQAIQMRIRRDGEPFMSKGKLVVRDAAGANPILLLDVATDITSGRHNTGDHLLFTTASFGGYAGAALVTDHTLANPIPASYLAAGRLTFEQDSNSKVLWSIAWGGAGYTGPHTGEAYNDLDKNFGPAFAGVLPSSSLKAIKFQGAAADYSTSNATDYAITPGASVWTNNAGASFTLVNPPSSADFDRDRDVDGINFLTWQRNLGSGGEFYRGDANYDGIVNRGDLAVWKAQYNKAPPLAAAVVAMPEPNAVLVALCGLIALPLRSARR